MFSTPSVVPLDNGYFMLSMVAGAWFGSAFTSRRSTTIFKINPQTCIRVLVRIGFTLNYFVTMYSGCGNFSAVEGSESTGSFCIIRLLKKAEKHDK
jgi:hypothetical protein